MSSVLVPLGGVTTTVLQADVSGYYGSLYTTSITHAERTVAVEK